MMQAVAARAAASAAAAAALVASATAAASLASISVRGVPALTYSTVGGQGVWAGGLSGQQQGQARAQRAGQTAPAHD